MFRTFIFAFQPCYGSTGGGQGVAYRLYEANKFYSLLENPIFVFGDRVIEGTNNPGALAEKTKQSSENGLILTQIKKIIPDGLFVLKRRLDAKHRKKYIRRLNETYQFTNDDVYIFHDVQLCSPFLDLFPFKHIIFVNHSQGSIYYEWKAQRGREAHLLHCYFNHEIKKVLSMCECVCFPSIGAEEALRETESSINKLLDTKEIRYLYNGISINGQDISEINNARSHSDILRFITVAQLNYAKGVEQIPSFLSDFERKGYEFTWTIIGDGAMAQDLESAIKESGIEKRVTWIRNYLSHEELLSFLMNADFYILFHRYSIFDLTTLEAMHFGVIPVLSNIGGNREVIINENGLLVDDYHDSDSLIDFINENDICSLAQKNQSIQLNYFSDEAFLKRYSELIEELVR